MLAGVLDGLDAAVVIALLNHVSPVRIFQFIASGLIGVRAFHLGGAAAALGVVLHFTIATGAAAVFYLLSLKWPSVIRRPLVCGPIYGLGVFAFMHYIVVPLSAAPKQPPAGAVSLLNLIFSHVFFVGVPIALVTRRNRNITAV